MARPGPQVTQNHEQPQQQRAPNASKQHYKPAQVPTKPAPSGRAMQPTGGRWTPEEDEVLKRTVMELGPKNWKNISAVAFQNRRSDVQCLHRWQKVLKPGLVKGAWTKDEDEVVIDMVRKNGVGNIKWSAIASQLPGRLGKQCRERWFNHLDPTLKKEPWSAEEDRILMEAQATMGNKWCQIASLLPGRSENTVKNRWNSAMRRRLQSTRRANAESGKSGSSGANSSSGGSSASKTAGRSKGESKAKSGSRARKSAAARANFSGGELFSQMQSSTPVFFKQPAAVTSASAQQHYSGPLGVAHPQGRFLTSSSSSAGSPLPDNLSEKRDEARADQRLTQLRRHQHQHHPGQRELQHQQQYQYQRFHHQHPHPALSAPHQQAQLQRGANSAQQHEPHATVMHCAGSIQPHYHAHQRPESLSRSQYSGAFDSFWPDLGTPNASQSSSFAFGSNGQLLGAYDSLTSTTGHHASTQSSAAASSKSSLISRLSKSVGNHTLDLMFPAVEPHPAPSMQIPDSGEHDFAYSGIGGDDSNNQLFDDLAFLNMSMDYGDLASSNMALSAFPGVGQDDANQGGFLDHIDDFLQSDALGIRGL